MANAKNEDFSLDDLRGGLDEDTPLHLLPKDACMVATNVEFFTSSLGERRRGCDLVSLTSSNLTNETQIVHISEWYPANAVTVPEQWVVAATPSTTVTIAKRTAGTWSPVTPTDAVNTSAPDVYGIASVALNGKKFFAYRSAVDRMHVWDGTTLRRTGLGEPAAPTAANQGSGAYTHIRFFRVRYNITSGSTVVARSEPSSSLTFTPSSTGASARITKPATISEGETHWEVEASEDDGNYYRIATVAVGTTTYDDTVLISDGINAIPASAPIPPGYVQLSNAAQILNMTGTVSNGAYSNNVTFPARGWVMYTSAGVYVAEGWVGHTPPAAGDVTYASQDVALALETAAGVGTHYSDVGTLSEDTGTYLTQPSFKFLAVVDGRLIGASHWTDTTKQSSVYWSPVFNDPGKGNDERLPLAVNNTDTLDNTEGGPITGIAPGIHGSWYAFKWKRIYKMTRTGDVTRAFVPLTLTTELGAIPGSIFNGIDANGNACIFFMDAEAGPYMLGTGGLQRIYGLQTTWKRVNYNATSVAVRGLYYPLKQQAHWWLAVDGGNTPTLKVIVQVSELRPTPDGSGLHRGLSLATGVITQAYAVGLVTESVTEGSVTTLRSRPFVGMATPNFLQRCDTLASVTDNNTSYTATIRSRPFFLAGLLDKWGAMNGSLFMLAVASGNVAVRLIRDMGLETITASPVSTAATASETYVIRALDDLSLSEATCIQVEFGDV